MDQTVEIHKYNLDHKGLKLV